ncbi:MAG: 50S ribosomal protein L35 [Thermoleophilia bacterium]|nr:50S ribosomal protein L35 [Thermoleophilia bacterium]
MPKQKTHSGAKKRFKVTGSGRLLRRHAMKSHNLEKKTAKRGRDFGRDHPVAEDDAREVRRLLVLPRARKR